ncbi:MAG: 5'-methylthioadenosine/adenosylhomocysteine nucleosidase [Candidatus Sumerlaeota bacterium]|nr:5'-methylthioadenosine/adenosylhomocysteine nucleosidase [Candidatus Sumerlaeota bacterium]
MKPHCRPGPIIAFVAILCSVRAFAADAPKPVTAILGAMNGEVELLKKNLESSSTLTVQGVLFSFGALNARLVVVARTGVGKVNAAMTTTLLIDHFAPREVVFTGIAGGLNPDLLPGDIVIAAQTAQHDFGVMTEKGLQHSGTRNPIDGKRNPLFLPADAQLLELAVEAGRGLALEVIPTSLGNRQPRIVQGVVTTGDLFIASEEKKCELRESLHADAVDMEGAAVAQICRHLGVPCLVIRSLSDLADKSAPDDSQRFSRIAAFNSAQLVMRLMERLQTP